jgi:glutamyl-tRNA reductase
MTILVLGLNHRSSPVEVREKFAFAENAIPAALSQLRNSGFASEVVILSTCNRVELYVATEVDPNDAFSGLRSYLIGYHDYQQPLDQEFYELSEPRSLQHLFRVAAGLDSMVLGETEILGQLKRAYDLALRHGYTGGKLNKAFQRAFNVAKHLRTETSIQRGSVSVGSVAVDLAGKIFSSLTDREVLVIGAGDTSEKTARALLSRGARGIVVTNRSPERAVGLAAELGGRAIPFDQWASEFAKIDIVISSTSADHYVLDRAKLEPLMKVRHNAPLLLIDIAVPRDVDPEVNFLPNVYLYNIDDLQAIAEGSMKQRLDEVARCEQIIKEKVKALLEAPGGPVDRPSDLSTASMRTAL